MGFFEILEDLGFDFQGWMSDGAARYQHPSGRLVDIYWHPEQELWEDSVLTHPVRIVHWKNGSKAHLELETEKELINALG